MGDTSAVKGPFLSQAEYLSLSSCLLCHSLHSSLPSLCQAIFSTQPQLLEQLGAENKHLLFLQAYYDFSKLRGPLPDISTPIFLYNLHDSLIGLLSALEGKISQELARDKVWKLLSGVRQMLVMALICSDKFVVGEVEARIRIFFPVLPRYLFEKTFKINYCIYVDDPVMMLFGKVG